jgi:hypothetical protein
MLDELTLGKLQRHGHPGESFPVILLSNGPTGRHASLFDAYVQKPVAVEQFLTLVSHLISERQKPASVQRH